MNAEQAEAFAQLVEAASAGGGGAACRLGDMYREGLGGLRYSPKQTYRWYSRSALAGDANGQNNLGACYEHGLGCLQSYTKALKWYRLSAAQQCGTASMNLGYCYLNGHGVPANKDEALRLFRLAVEQGEEKAVKEVERLEGTMDKPKVRVVRGIEFVEETEPGKLFGLVGVGGVAPPGEQISDEERLRLELLKVLKFGEADATAAEDELEYLEATDDELFPIYAECGIKPDYFVPELAAKYAEYLEAREREKI
jgi:hypothetical protein